jgi:hypothetical protein
MFRKIITLILILLIIPVSCFSFMLEATWESGQTESPEPLTYQVYIKDRLGAISQYPVNPGDMCYQFEWSPVNGVIELWVTAKNGCGIESEASDKVLIKQPVLPKDIKVKKK